MPNCRPTNSIRSRGKDAHSTAIRMRKPGWSGWVTKRSMPEYKQLATNAKLSQDQITPAQAALEQKDVHTYNSWYDESHSVGRRRGQRPRLSLLVRFLEGLWCREGGRLDTRKGVPPRQ